MSIAEKYMRNEKAQDEADAVLLMLRILSKDPARFDLSSEERAEVEKATSSVEYQNKALVTIYRERLGKLWEDYIVPLWDMRRVRGEYEKAKIRVAQAAQNDAADQPVEVTREQTFLAARLFEDTIALQDGAKFRLNPATGWPMKDPIQYDSPIEWVTFSKEVHWNPYTKQVDLHRTLGNLLTRCQKVGCNRQQCTEVLKLMVENHFPTYYNALSYTDDPNTVWELILGMLDYSAHLTKVKTWMKSIKRRLGQGVNEPVQEYTNLIREILNIQSPYATDEENREVALKEAAKSIKHFVTKACWAQVKALKERYFQKHRQHMTLEELFNFVTFCENEPGMKPTSVLSLDNQEVKIDLFISDTHQTWTWQFGADYSNEGANHDQDGESDVEVHSNETGPAHQYENYQFPPPAQPDRDGPTTRSMPPTAADLRARENPRHSIGDKPGQKSTRRRVQRSQPGSDKSKTPTRSRSGSSSASSRASSTGSVGTVRARSTSSTRSSKERSDSKKSSRSNQRAKSESSKDSKKASQKQPSKSGANNPERPRRSRNRDASPGRCWLCWIRHPEGRCDYGKIKPSKDMCDCKKGYHPRNVCLNRAGSPARRSSSKSRFGGDNFLPNQGSGN